MNKIFKISLAGWLTSLPSQVSSMGPGYVEYKVSLGDEVTSDKKENLVRSPQRRWAVGVNPKHKI